MRDQSTLDNVNSDSIDSYRVLCKECRATLPLHLFLHPVDPSCYRVRVQCKRCIEKSVKNWRAHREDIKAARATRERDRGRITCVCGTSINTRYRAQQLQIQTTSIRCGRLASAQRSVARRYLLNHPSIRRRARRRLRRWSAEWTNLDHMDLLSSLGFDHDLDIPSAGRLEQQAVVDLSQKVVNVGESW
jgi:hypothetical protein